MTHHSSKMAHRFQIHFDGFAQCSQEHNADLTEQVLTATRGPFDYSGGSKATNSIILKNDVTNRVLSKISAQLNRQKKQSGQDRPYFRVLMRDLTGNKAVISTTVLANCLIQSITLSPLDCANPEEQTIEIVYSHESSEFSFSRSEPAI